MSTHHTKDKGDLGVLKAQVDIAEQGYKILTPLSEHLPFDIVGWKDGVFLSFQVKYRNINKFGAIDVAFKTCWSDRQKTHYKPIDKALVDLFVVYCPDTDECYYVKPSSYGKSVTLRVNAPKNNQKQHVLLASDFRKIP